MGGGFEGGGLLLGTPVASAIRMLPLLLWRRGTSREGSQDSALVKEGGNEARHVSVSLAGKLVRRWSLLVGPKGARAHMQPGCLLGEVGAERAALVPS